jgi:DNA invertase Pin-like site-specific DNA recombinase
MQHIYAAMAQKERALISERTKAAKKAQGVKLGNSTTLAAAKAKGAATQQAGQTYSRPTCCRCAADPTGRRDHAARSQRR